MKELIEIHNKSTYRRIYNSLSTKFIDYFCEARKNGLDVRDSVFEANRMLREYLMVEIARNYSNVRTVVKAYHQLKNDSELIEAAILCYQSMK